MVKSEKTVFDISPGFALAASVIYFLDRQGMFALVAVSAIVHELGHYIALRVFGAKPYLLRLEITGAAMFFDESALGYSQEVLVALAGPFFGAVLAAAAAGFHAYTLAGVSAVLSVFNLLPVGGLDGGRILRARLSSIADENRADRAVTAVTIFFSAAMVVAGFAVGLYCGFGWALIPAGLALLIRQIRR